MYTKTINTLEFNIILQKLATLALSEKAKDEIINLKPYLKEKECKRKLLETSEAVKILKSSGYPPLSSMKELEKILDLTQKGAMLIPEQLMSVASFINDCKRMKSYLKNAEYIEVSLTGYGAALNDIIELYNTINISIRGGNIDDNASTKLREIRRKIININLSIKEKLESILKSRKECFSDGFIVNRNGRPALPVKKEYKNQISGTVIDTSGSGGTYFIEPTSVRKLQDELSLLQIDEDNEVRKILYILTGMVEDYIKELKINAECMGKLDFVFAKGKLALDMDGIWVPITTDGIIKINKGRHPLLDKESCVPLNFSIGGKIKGIIITGPNTGGKTVALKTVGLLSLMTQCGLLIPVQEGSSFSMCSNILCDIGDGQSISQNLSTFSAHITNIIEILQQVSKDSLVLLDELGSGTDPAEGMGIAVAILDELRKKECLFLATTHYPEIKEYAATTNGLLNARMEFDRESLKPLYGLEIGEAGESCALYIARRLGLPEHMLKTAYNKAYLSNNKNTATIPLMSFSDTTTEIKSSNSQKIVKEKPKSQLLNIVFDIGDSVIISPLGEHGIVYSTINNKGEVGVQIMGIKQLIGYKRINLKTKASELYPSDYDFSIIFDTVENRKARHKMSKRHDENLVIKLE